MYPLIWALGEDNAKFHNKHNDVSRGIFRAFVNGCVQIFSWICEQVHRTSKVPLAKFVQKQLVLELIELFMPGTAIRYGYGSGLKMKLKISTSMSAQPMILLSVQCPLCQIWEKSIMLTLEMVHLYFTSWVRGKKEMQNLTWGAFCLSFQDWKKAQQKVFNCSVMLVLLLPLKESSAAL